MAVKEKRQANPRKVKEGIVVSDKMQKTVTVRVDRTFRHPEFEKVITRGKKYYAHCENNDVKVGQKVKIIETRPLSKLKRWRVVEVLAEAQPT
ncbi:MAG TPA: 30S ribosomal protein S17 [Rhabdochlamydiaceae bacterium]|nr:30S ribosomal protein S17 [Rhabdochlamydiaceae bacterium]